MFCHQCGAKLAEGMQFCPFCGTKAVEVEPIQDQETTEETEEVLTLSVLGETIQFEGDIDICVWIRQKFEELGDDISREFADRFYSRYRDMDAFIRDFRKDFPGMFKVATNYMNECLSEVNIFGVTEDEILPYAQKYCYRTFLVLHEIEEQYQKIITRQEEMQEYRQFRKDHRGRLVGGGFGLQGAVKGIMTAGAVNMASGAVHSIGNVIGNMGSALSAANAKDNLFKSGIVTDLAHAIKEDILGVHLMFIDIITARTGIEIPKFTKEDEARADKILTDLEESLIPRENEKVAIAQMLEIYPFNPAYYRIAIRLYPSELEDLRSIAELFNFDIDKFYLDMKRYVDPAVTILQEYRYELENLLLDDLDYSEKDMEPLTTNLNDMLGYFDRIFTWANEDGFYFLPDEDDKAKSKLSGAKSSYAYYGKEKPLILYDSTLGNSGKSGFLVTNKHVYIKDGSRSITMTLYDAITDIQQRKNSSNNCDYLYFGEHKVYLLHSGEMVKENILGDFVELLLALILFIVILKPKTSDLWKAITQYQHLQPSDTKKNATLHNIEPKGSTHTAEVCYCFECGTENEAGDKFCCECGAKLI